MTQEKKEKAKGLGWLIVAWVVVGVIYSAYVVGAICVVRLVVRAL